MKKIETIRTTKTEVNTLIGRGVKKRLESVFFEFGTNEDLYYKFCEAVGFEIVHPSTNVNIIVSTTINAIEAYENEQGDLFDKNRRFIAAILDGMEQCSEYLITVNKGESSVFFFDIFNANFIEWAEQHDEHCKISINYTGHQENYSKYRTNCRLLMLSKIASRRQLELLGVVPPIKDVLDKHECSINV